MLYRPGYLRNFLREINAGPKKSLSQNFLIDGNIIKKIICAAGICSEDVVLEIGPGPGVLTEALLESRSQVIAIEKDRLFAQKLSRFRLSEESAGNVKLKIIEADFLKILLPEILPKNKKIKVVANLPYNIASPILISLLKHHALFSQITVMLQKEVAQRITAAPHNKNYSSLSILVNFFAEAKYVFTVSRNCFYPRPKVDSALMNLRIKENPPRSQCPEDFFNLVRKCFQKRRKKLLTTLGQFYPQEKLKPIFQTLAIPENARPENLTGEKFWQLFGAMASFQKNFLKKLPAI